MYTGHSLNLAIAPKRKGNSVLVEMLPSIGRYAYGVPNEKFESIAKRMIKYLLFARSHEIWQREIL